MPNLTCEFLRLKNMIDRIEFTPIMTGITFTDGSMSFAVRSPLDEYDPEKGFAFALLNRLFGNDFFKQCQKFIPNDLDTSTEDNIIEIMNDLAQDNQYLQDALDKARKEIDELSAENEYLMMELDKLVEQEEDDNNEEEDEKSFFSDLFDLIDDDDCFLGKMNLK